MGFNPFLVTWIACAPCSISSEMQKDVASYVEHTLVIKSRGSPIYGIKGDI